MSHFEGGKGGRESVATNADRKSGRFVSQIKGNKAPLPRTMYTDKQRNRNEKKLMLGAQGGFLRKNKSWDGQTKP